MLQFCVSACITGTIIQQPEKYPVYQEIVYEEKVKSP